MDFCNMAPEELILLDLSKLTREELVNLDYFLWCFFPVEPSYVVSWRESKLMPILASLPRSEDGDEDEDDDEDENEEDVDF